MRFALSNAILTIGLAVPGHAFDLDRPYPEVMKHFGQPLVRELMVGETGVILSSGICSKDDKLYLVASAMIEEPKLWHVLSVTREAGGTVRMTMAMETRVDATTVIERGASPPWIELISTAKRSCDALIASFHTEPDLIPVSTVNGYASISAAMEAD